MQITNLSFNRSAQQRRCWVSVTFARRRPVIGDDKWPARDTNDENRSGDANIQAGLRRMDSVVESLAWASPIRISRHGIKSPAALGSLVIGKQSRVGLQRSTRWH